MNQQMIHGLPITATYARPINKIKPLTLHIYPNEYFIPSCSLNKKETCLRAFTPQIPFQGKAIEEEPHRAL